MNRVIFNLKRENVKFEIEDSYIKQCFHGENKYTFWQKRKLLRYLSKSSFLVGICDLAECIFSNKLIGHNETWYTDREWVWSADLMHYTKKYNFQWPKEFIQTLENKNYKPSQKISNEENIKLISDPVFLKYAEHYQKVDFSDFG